MRAFNIAAKIKTVFSPHRAVRGMRRQSRVPTMFGLKIRDDSGRIGFVRPPVSNLRTNAGIDWQAGAMGDYRSFGANASQHPTSNGTSTTVTDTGQAWATNQWAGHIVVFATSAGLLGFGVCLSNTATVITVDGWWALGVPGSSAVTPPQTTANYGICPGQAPHWWMALSSTVQSGNATDTTLAGEYTTIGLARSLPTSYTHSAGVNSYSIAKTYTFTGTGTVNSEAVFVAQNGGLMPFEAAEPSPPTGVSGDTLAQTHTVTI